MIPPNSTESLERQMAIAKWQGLPGPMTVQQQQHGHQSQQMLPQPGDVSTESHTPFTDGDPHFG